MKIINLTPHVIHVHTADGVKSLQPSGAIARVEVVLAPVSFSPASGIICYAESCGDVVGLPAADAGTALVVSQMVRVARKDRRDLLSPGELIRDDAGRPIGCRGLIGNWGRE